LLLIRRGFGCLALGFAQGQYRHGERTKGAIAERQIQRIAESGFQRPRPAGNQSVSAP
jgi:hypothetical protein